MKTLTCVPAYLYPLQRLNFSCCSVVPGVSVVRTAGPIGDTTNSLSANLSVKPEFDITHVVCIDEDLYLAGLKQRLIAEGSSLPERMFIEAEAIAKQAILSLILAGRMSFKFRGVHKIQVEKKNRRLSYTPSGYSHGSLHQMSESVEAALLQDTGTWPAIAPRKAAAIAQKLDRYYRSGMWWTDRLAMSIGYFWDALCTPFSQQAFLGLTNSLEALLSTQSTEITHTLAERVALLTEKKATKRLGVYKAVKDLYRVRSKIVHGNTFPKQGKQNWESLLVTAKWSNVPISSLSSLLGITLTVITAVLSDRSLLEIIQPRRNEQKISEDFNQYFATMVFGR